MKHEQSVTIKTLTKRSVWDIYESDIFRLWKNSERDADLKDNRRHYIDVINTAFEMEEITTDKPEIIKKYEERGYKIGVLKGIGKENSKWGVKKRKIMRVNELTYDNIHHISASTLLEIIDRNFGGGWDTLSENTRNIIQSCFDISTTTLPKDRLHNPGGIYDKKVSEQYEILEIPKGTWVEVIFAKKKADIVPTVLKGDESTGMENDYDDFENENTVYDEDEDAEFGDSFDDELKDGDVFDDVFADDGYDTDFDGNEDLTIDDVVAAEDET